MAGFKKGHLVGTLLPSFHKPLSLGPVESDEGIDSPFADTKPQDEQLGLECGAGSRAGHFGDLGIGEFFFVPSEHPGIWVR